MFANLSSVQAARDHQTNKWSFGVPLERTGAVPLDKWSWWTSLAEASAYTKSSDKTKVSYPGQLLTVADAATSSVAAYLVEANGDLTKLAAGGSTDELNTKLQTEINQRTAADTYISSQVSALPGQIDAAKTDLKVTVEAAATATAGYLKTYVIKQGGEECDVKIDIPKDFLVKSAEVKTCTAADQPEAGYKVGDKYIDFVINTQEGDATATHLHVNVQDLVDVYKGYDGTTIKTEIADGNAIKAEVKDGAITAAKLAAAVSAEISGATAGVAANAAAVTSAVADLKAYADAAEADALSAAKAHVGSEIGKLDATITAGKSGEMQKFFTKITQTDGVVNADAAVIQYTDVNGLTAQIEDIQNSISTTVNTKINALDVTDEVVDKKFVTAVSQTDGKIAVTRDTISLDDLTGDLKSEITTLLSGTYDAAGAAAAAENSAKTAAASALDAAKAELTGLVSDTSAATLTAAKDYADGKVNVLKTTVDTISGDLDTAESAIDAVEEDVATLSTDINALNTFAKTTLSNALTAEVSRATSAEETINSALTALKSDYAAVSADHKTRLEALESGTETLSADLGAVKGKVDLLSSAMHFRGVLQQSDLTSTTEAVSAALDRVFLSAADGDVVVYTGDGTEYVYASDAWHELGNEDNHATKSALAAEETARTAADTALSTAISKKIYVDGQQTDSLSVQNISRDAYHELVAAGTTLSNCVYVVSSDTLNMYGEKIENLLSGSADGDAVNVAQLNAAKTSLEAAIEGSKISAASFNGTAATISANAIWFDISCIDCGGADA